MYIGDFNDLMYVYDKQGNDPHPQNLLEGFGIRLKNVICQKLSCRAENLRRSVVEGLLFGLEKKLIVLLVM